MKSNDCITPALGRSVLTSSTIKSTAIQSTAIVSYTGYYWAYYWCKDSTSDITETYTISSISSISIAKALLPIQCISRDSQQGYIIQKKSTQHHLPDRAKNRGYFSTWHSWKSKHWPCKWSLIFLIIIQFFRIIGLIGVGNIRSWQSGNNNQDSV